MNARLPVTDLPPALLGFTGWAQWLNYRLTPQPNGKTRKEAIGRGGYRVSPTDPAEWMSYEEAAATGLPLAFCFSERDPFFFLDIDGALNADGQWSPLAQGLMRRMHGCAVEVSSSGRGLHIFGLGTVDSHSSRRDDLGLEFYTKGRFVALTGNMLTPDGSVFHSPPELPALVAEYFPPSQHQAATDWTDGPCEGWAGPTDDDELVRRASRHVSAAAAFAGKATFADLWNGNEDALGEAFPDSTRPYDCNRADAALCAHLAWWTGKDCERMARLLRASGLARDKHDREDYVQRTVLRACGLVGDVLRDKTKTDKESASPSAYDSKKLMSGEIVMVKGSELRPKPVHWLWKDWLAKGKFHILAGAPGQGKTTIALSMAATISSGGKWPDGTSCVAGDVIIWSGEDDPADTLQPRLKASGANLERCYFIKGMTEDGQVVPFDPAKHISALSAALAKTGNPSLLIVDPVVNAVTGDSHKNTEVRRALQPLQELGERIGCAVLGITHLSKGGQGGDLASRVVGSIAFTALARIVMIAAKTDRDDGDVRILARSKSNIGPDTGGFEYRLEQAEPFPEIHASYVAWGDAQMGTANDLINGPSDKEESQAEADCVLLQDVLRGKDWVNKAEIESVLRPIVGTTNRLRSVFRFALKNKHVGQRKEPVKNGPWQYRLITTSTDSTPSPSSTCSTSSHLKN